MLKLIKKYIKGYGVISILGPVFKLLEAAIELILPLIVADIINVGIKELQSAPYVWRGGIIMLVLYIVSFGFAVVCQYLAAKSAYGYGTNLRRALYKHINDLPLSVVDRFQTPTLITRINLDIVNTQNALNRFIRLVTRAPFILIGALIMSVMINPRLSLIFFGATILLSVALYFIMKSSSPKLKKINLSHDEVTLLTRENLSGARVVRAFNKQHEEEKEFKQASDDLKRQSIFLGLVTALSSPLTYLIINTGIILIVYLGAFEVNSARLTDGEIVALINYMMQILNSMLVLAMMVNLFTKAAVSAKRINEVLDCEVECADGLDIIPDSDTALKFDNVSVSYGENAGNSLEGVSFTLKKGQTLGIIGSTGSGKSTLVNLIPRLYDYGGTIEFFGEDLKKLSAKSLRRCISVAPQKAVLFSGTVRENMRLAKEDAEDSEIAAALKAAQCGFVETLGAVVARGGSNFSGGQRQRLCIARALIKNPRLLILDDSMSALDYSTEADIKKHLNSLTNLTKIIVTQRALSIKNADLILVLEEGKVAGCGKHNDLLNNCPVYREISQIQGGIS